MINRYVDINYIEQEYFVEFSEFDYVEFDYVEYGYISKPYITANASIQSDFTLTSDLTRLHSLTASMSSSSSVSITADRIRYADGTISASSTISATTLRVRSAEVNLSAFNTTLTVGDRSRPAAAVLASEFTQSASANYTFGPSLSLSTTALISATMAVTKPATAALSAFDTVLTAGARIRSLGSDMTASTLLSASPVKIRTAKIGEITGLHFDGDRFLTINPVPIRGYPQNDSADNPQLGNLRIYQNYPIETGDYLGNLRYGQPGQGFITSVWARVDEPNLRRGYILSSSGFSSTFYPLRNQNEFSLGELSGSNYAGESYANLQIIGENDLTGPTYVPSITFANSYQPDTNWHHYLWHITSINLNLDAPIDGRRWQSTANLYIDGEYRGNITSLTEENIDPIIFNPLYVGALNRSPALGFDQLPQSRLWQGDIRQIWMGFDRLGGNVLGDNYAFNIQDFYNNGLVELGQHGRGLNDQLPQPMVYQPLDYYNLQGYDQKLTAHLWTNASSLTGNVTSIDSSWLPNDHLPGIISRFTLFGSGDRTIFAEFSANSVASLTSSASYNKPVSADLAVAATFTAESYDFTKATASLASEFTQTTTIDRIRYAEVNIASALSAILVASDKNSGTATLASEFTVVADPTTDLLGIVSTQAAFNFSATAYDFTKAQAAITANFDIAAEGRYQARTRANADIISTATLTSIPDRIRPGDTALTTVSSLLLADGGALRSGNIAMSAFNTVLTAGKLIEFYVENTLKVTQETGNLHVYDDVESNVLLVQEDQELNKIYVADGLETTVIYPEQETGVLLSQHRQPTF